jgi:hypothetical protein
MTTPVTWDVATYSAAPLQDYLQKSFVGNMIRYQPAGMTPLFLLTSMMGAGTATNVKHSFFSKEMIWPRVQLNGAVAAAGTTAWVVDSTANIVAGDILQGLLTPLGEQVLVEAVTSSTGLTVRRAFGTVAAAASYLDDTQFVKIGNAFEQASLRPAAVAINPIPVENYTQIFRNSWALARTAAAIKPIVGDDLSSENKTDAGALHSKDIETNLILGQRYLGTRNNQQITKMDGIVSQLQQYAPGNISPAGATTNYTQLNAFLDKCFDKAVNSRMGTERALFVGAQALRVINEIGRKNGTYQLVQGQTDFGLQFKSFSTDRGSFKIIEHPVLNSNTTWSACALAVDFTALKLAYLTGGQTKHTGYGEDGKAVEGGLDAVGGTLLTEVTLENINASAHAFITGLTSGVAG